MFLPNASAISSAVKAIPATVPIAPSGPGALAAKDRADKVASTNSLLLRFINPLKKVTNLPTPPSIPPAFGFPPGEGILGNNAAAIASGFAISNLVNPEAILPIVFLTKENPVLIANNPPPTIAKFFRILNLISLNNFVLFSSDALMASTTCLVNQPPNKIARAFLIFPKTSFTFGTNL